MRSRTATGNSVHAWNFNDAVVEHYRYTPGPAGAVAPHAHPDYQLCVSLDAAGEYHYRGARRPVPARSVSLLHPDEPHAARDPEARQHSSEYWVTYLTPSLVCDVAERRSPPFLEEAVHVAPALFARFALLPRQMISAPTEAARQFLLRSALRELLARAGVRPAANSNESVSFRRLQRVREYLEDDPARNPSLDSLAAIAGLSPWRFCREFSARFGQPPHAYLLHARIRRAKNLLARGVSIGDVAQRCGFADQSHFTRCFRRYVDVTPGLYRSGKNVQYAPLAA